MYESDSETPNCAVSLMRLRFRDTCQSSFPHLQTGNNVNCVVIHCPKGKISFYLKGREMTGREFPSWVQYPKAHWQQGWTKVTPGHLHSVQVTGGRDPNSSTSQNVDSQGAGIGSQARTWIKTLQYGLWVSEATSEPLFQMPLYSALWAPKMHQ